MAYSESSERQRQCGVNEFALFSFFGIVSFLEQMKLISELMFLGNLVIVDRIEYRALMYAPSIVSRPCYEKT